ncbi:hypothetical protein ACFX1R_014251 [Malus domestica]
MRLGSRTAGGLNRIQVSGSEIGVPGVEPLDSHHGVKIEGVEIGASRRRVSGRAQAVNLSPGEVRRSRCHCRERPP